MCEEKAGAAQTLEIAAGLERRVRFTLISFGANTCICKKKVDY